MQLITSLRVQDIAIRKADMELKKIEREQKIEEKRLRDERREPDKKEYIDNLEPGTEFIEEEFQTQWLEKNPDPEIPPQVQDEFDLDLENNEAT